MFDILFAEGICFVIYLFFIFWWKMHFPLIGGGINVSCSCLTAVFLSWRVWVMLRELMKHFKFLNLWSKVLLLVVHSCLQRCLAVFWMLWLNQVRLHWPIAGNMWFSPCFLLLTQSWVQRNSYVGLSRIKLFFFFCFSFVRLPQDSVLRCCLKFQMSACWRGFSVCDYLVQGISAVLMDFSQDIVMHFKKVELPQFWFSTCWWR